MSGERHTRNGRLDHTRADTEARTCPVVISTDTPANRPGYVEILKHTSSAVNLERQPLPMVIGHDTGKLPIGVVEGLRITGGKLRGTARFGKSAAASEVWTDVQQGVICSVSVGYSVDDYVEVGDTITVTRWTPLECSCVAVPLDAGAGFNRGKFSMSDEINEAAEESPRLSRSQRRQMRQQAEQAEFAAEQERARIRQIQKIGDHFNLPADQVRDFVDTGADLEEVRNAVRARKPEPIPTDTYWRDSRARQAQGPRVHTRVLDAFSHDRSTAEQRAFDSGMWIRAALLGDRQARAYVQSRGMSISGASKGNVLVPDELASAIINLSAEYGVIRRYAQVWPMSGDSLTVPRRQSGPTGYFVGEAATATASDMTLGGITLTPRKVVCRTDVSAELFEDSAFDIVGLVAGEYAREFARIEDSCGFAGDATSAYGGITGLRSALAGLAGAVDAAAGNDTFVEVTDADLTAVMAALPSYARPGAKWFCSYSAMDNIFGRLIAAAGGASMAETMMSKVTAYRGHEIVPVATGMPETADAADGVICVLFGDLSQAVAFGDRRGMAMRVDDVSKLASDQLVLQASMRFDVNCHGVGDATTAGPIVGLALNTA